MNREEALEYFKNKTVVLTEEEALANAMAIEALEQEPIIDKIRAEIIEMRSKQNCSCADCLDIIDKYRAESEE